MVEGLGFWSLTVLKTLGFVEGNCMLVARPITWSVEILPLM